jgi:toxin CptA
VKQAPAIGFHYKVSWMLVGATVVVALLALLALQLVAGPAWLRHTLHGLTVAYAGVYVIGLLRPRVVSLVWHAEGAAEITLRGDTADNTRVVQGAVNTARIMGPLIVLTLRWPPRARAHLWLLPDNLDADTRRRLRMRLGADPAGTLQSGNADNG